MKNCCACTGTFSKLIEKRMWIMNATFPSAMVGGLDEIEGGFSLPDPNDNHVLAAALR